MECELCGSPMEYFEEGLCMGWRCAACGADGPVTTNSSHLVFDSTAYDIFLASVDAPDLQVIAVVASTLGVGAKEMRLRLSEGRPLAERLSNVDALALHDRLAVRGIVVRTEPALDLEELRKRLDS